MFTYHLPGKQVAAGDNWGINVTTTSGGMWLDINTKNHLDGINGNSANLTIESTIKASSNAAPIISGPAKVTYDDINGLSKSNFIVSLFLLVSFTTQAQNIKGKVCLEKDKTPVQFASVGLVHLPDALVYKHQRTNL